MSPEQIELRNLVAIERRATWLAAKRLPGCAGDAVSAFARVHPMWAAGGAGAIAMLLVARKARAPAANGRTVPDARTPSSSSNSSWITAAAAIGVRFLPDLLRMVGLTTPPDPKDAVEESEPTAAPPDPVNVRA